MPGVGMRPPVFRGMVKDGKIILDNQAGFSSYRAKFEGQRIEVILRARNVSRSDQQNKYYHGVVVSMIADHLGYEKEEMHELLKKQFKVESTARLKTAEFKEYVDDIVRWAASDLGIPIPDPHEIDY
jgi:hypothetical protein